MMLPIRTLFGVEMSRYRDHLLGLDGVDRRLRFGHVVTDAAIERYVSGIDGVDGRVLALMDGALDVRAAVLISTRDRAVAELAFTVDAAARRAGIGTRLAERALLSARNRGIRRVVICCLPENRAMRRLAARIGMAITVDDGLCEGTLEVPAATPLSYLREGMLEAAAVYELGARWHLRALTDGALPLPRPAA